MGLSHGEDFDFEGSTFEEEEDEDLMYDDDLVLQEVYYLVEKVSSKIQKLEELVLDDPEEEAVKDAIKTDDKALGQDPNDVDEASGAGGGGVSGYTLPLGMKGLGQSTPAKMRKFMQKFYGEK